MPIRIEYQTSSERSSDSTAPAMSRQAAASSQRTGRSRLSRRGNNHAIASAPAPSRTAGVSTTRHGVRPIPRTLGALARGGNPLAAMPAPSTIAPAVRATVAVPGNREARNEPGPRSPEAISAEDTQRS